MHTRPPQIREPHRSGRPARSYRRPRSLAARDAFLAGLCTAIAASTLLAAHAAAAEPSRLPAGVEKVESAGGITEYRLKANGMPILLLPDHAAPVFTFMVVYHVGSRNESPGNTGSAHLLEHLLFNKSTRSFGRAKGHKTFQEVLYEAGADFSSTNMTTWYDRMNGYSTLPSDKLALAMKIEADRLGRALLLDEERQTEMTVVRNEYEIGENDPSEALYKAVVGAAITAHPYHWTTIGYRSDIEGVTIEKLREHYRTYFWPDNATAILVGDFDALEALRLFEREFGDFRRSSRPIPKVITEEPPQEGERRVIVRRPGEVGLIEAAYMRPGSMHPDFIPLDVLSAILGDGVNSRLYQALVETGLATQVSAWNFTLRDPFPLLLNVTLAPGSTHRQAENALQDALRRVAREGVTVEELERARKQIEVAVTRSRDGTYAMASSLGEAVASADWKWFVGYLDQLSRVTADDLRRVASTYLVDDHATVGWFVPVEAEAAAAPSAAAEATPGAGSAATPSAGVRATPSTGAEATPSAGVAGSVPPAPAGTESPAPARTAPPAPASGDPRKSFAERTAHRILGNGIVLDIVENRAVPTVAIRGSFIGGTMTAPSGRPALPQLTAMMVQRGTARRDKRAIAAALDGVGARRSFGTTPYETTLTASCLSADLPLLLDVLAEEILSPSFPDSELAKARLEMKTDVMREAENTSTRAIDRLFQIVLPEGHPHRPVDPEAMIASVGAITSEEIRGFHRERYVGSAFALAIVGDVEAEEVARLVTERFGALAKGERPAFSAAPAASPGPSGSSSDAGEREVVRMPGKASWNLVLGHSTTLTRSDPDYEAALLANAALGQNDLSSRIGRRVRDTEGLSYVIYSRFTLADVLDGVWLVNAFVAPENLERAYRSTREVIESYCREGIEEEELEAQKSFFAGNYNVRLGSNAGVAAALVEAERLGFTPAYLDEYPSRIRAVSLEQANAAIRTHLRPEALQVVVAGDPEASPQ